MGLRIERIYFRINNKNMLTKICTIKNIHNQFNFNKQKHKKLSGNPLISPQDISWYYLFFISTAHFVSIYLLFFNLLSYVNFSAYTLKTGLLK